MFYCQVFWGFSALHFHFLPAANQTWDWGSFFPISLKGIVWHFQTMHLHPEGRRAGKPRCDCLVYCLLVKIEAIVTSQVAPINKIESINVVWRWSVMIPRYVSYFMSLFFSHIVWVFNVFKSKSVWFWRPICCLTCDAQTFNLKRSYVRFRARLWAALLKIILKKKTSK